MEEKELLEKLRGYIDLKRDGIYTRFMLIGWFAPSKIAGFNFTYEYQGRVRLGEDKAIPSYKCVVSGKTLKEALENMLKFLQDNHYDDLLIYDANTHFEMDKI